MNKAFIVSVLLSLIAILLLPKPSLSVFLVLLVDIALFSIFSKTDDEKIASLFALGGLALVALALGGVHTGIDFSGGTRIVISLSQPVDQQTMNEIIDKIKGRVSAFGLEQVVATGVGNNLIYLDVPSTDSTFPQRIENIISKQGKFIAIVDGKVVLTGKDILPGTVVPTFRPDQIGRADWGVSFSITPEANVHFLENVKGKANRPIYMFLDPVENAYIILSKSKLEQLGVVPQVLEVLTYLNDTIVYEEELNNTTIPDDVLLITSLEQFRHRNNTIVVNETELYPEVVGNSINSWKAIGLVSAPRVSPSLASGKGVAGLSYLITGTVQPGQDPREEAKYIASVLKGGAFPVKLEISGITRIPGFLGEETFKYSLAGIWVAVLIISLYLAWRYRKLKIFIPLFITTLIENLILLTIVGQFSLDLAAMAGLIAAAGVSIDGQIIITDMWLKKKDEIKQAFEIIKNNTFIALVVMLPLIAVGSPEVVGFGVTTAIAYILGYLVSRNSYYSLLKKFA